LKDPDKFEPKLLAELYTHGSLADEFPGVTEKNAKKVLKSKLTLAGLSEADNASLRKMGISPSFYGRLREHAAELAEAEAEQEE
jgi:ERCC4-type nuclease